LPYNIKVWQNTWPVIMENVIKACHVHNARLVFFDNIYMYDPSDLNPITEENLVNPSSKKGKMRAEIAQMLLDAHNRGDIIALIARSADFYGPSIKASSVLNETVFKPLSEGKAANWLGGVQYKHSYTYTPDAGKATALLGNTPEAYGQVWHLPTASNHFTGKEWIEAIAKELGVAPKYRVANKFIVRLMGLFMPVMKEMVEMMYQYDRDYVFNSDKFEKRFDFKPTPYLTGIQDVVKNDYKK
jgi:nucleoside-diphosphate-sugar epimerase